MIGKREEAELYYLEAMKCSRRILGDDDQATLVLAPDKDYAAKASEWRAKLRRPEDEETETATP